MPDYPDNSTTDAEKYIKARYAQVFISVSRKGNSGRRRRRAMRPQQPAQDGRLDRLPLFLDHRGFKDALGKHAATLKTATAITNEEELLAPRRLPSEQ